MNRTLLTDILRHIRRHLGRFAAMACIAMLGAAFFVGIRATGPSMRMTAQAYYNEHNFSDIRLLSTLGFTAEDIEWIRASGVLRDVLPGYTADVLAGQPDSMKILHLMSYDPGAEAVPAGVAVNTPLLLEGRLPENAWEAAVDEKFFEDDETRKPGDTVALFSGTDKPLSDTLTVDTVTIVGVVRSPLYTAAFERGGSGIGGGSADAFMLLLPSAFALECYTEIYATVDNPDGLSRFDPAYNTLSDPAKTALEDLGATRAPLRYDSIAGEAREKLTEAKNKLADGEKELADGAQKLIDAERELETGEADYAAGLAEYEDQIAEGQRKLDEAGDELRAAKRELDGSDRTLARGEAQWAQAGAALDDAKEQIDSLALAIQFQAAQAETIEAQLIGLPPDSAAYAELFANLAVLRGTIDAMTMQLDEASAQYNAGESEWRAQGEVLAAGRAQWERGRRDYDEGYVLYRENLAEFETRRDDGARELAEARGELDKGAKELEEGRAEYDAQVLENQPKIDDARAEIADGEKALEDIPKPEWYVLDLNANEAFADYKENCNRIVAVGNIFPLFFFLVAALISLTTMTRTVEDDRAQIGLLKALGYGRGHIAMKYVIVAASATVLGLALGLTLGFNLFPRLLAGAYGMLYRFPPLLVSFDVPHSLLATGLSLVSTIGPALFICYKSLRERPAALMLPKAPPPGRKIFLERIPPVWRRLSFLQKVTARNILRYVKRMLMTLIGIAGCTALVFTGFGLNESVHALISNQFDRVMVFDCSARLSATGTQANREEAMRLFEEHTASALPLCQKSVDIDAGGAPKLVSLFCPLEPERLDGFIRLRDAGTKAPLTLSDDGAVLSGKAARLLGVGPGDLVRVRVGEGRYASVTVTGLAENYFDHYLYVTPQVYERLFGQPPEVNTLFGNLDAGGESVAAALLASDGMAGVQIMADERVHFADMISALGYVVAVLILSAAALAFVVLFSLSGINVEERRREIATIKVLGFYDREVSDYINRETLALALCGAAMGLFFGLGLLQFVLATAEVDMIVFSRETSVWSYLWSFLLTTAFTLIVNRIMDLRLRKVDMVESLKSVE